MDTMSDCPCSGKNLDRFIQPMVLAVLFDGPLHGYRILKRLGATPMFEGRKPDATGIYRFLKAMETASWLTPLGTCRIPAQPNAGSA